MSTEPERTEAQETERALKLRTRRSFLALGGGALAGLAGWRWLRSRPRIDDLPSPFRRMLEWNEGVAEGYFDDARLAKTYPRDLAREPRVNGDEGMRGDFDPAAWQLRLQAPGVERVVTLDEIRRLPRVEMTTDLKCIEGWSVIVTWAGARLRDFAAAQRVGTRDGSAPDVRQPRRLLRYVSLVTPNAAFYVGLDMPSALHEQTLLVYEMNGEPLTVPHGAPLRLVTTVKYGIKSIKRIGTIAFTDTRPPDFWAEQGYDWYAGH